MTTIKSKFSLIANVDCTYQNLVLNVISIDYVLIRYTFGRGK